MKIEFGYWQLIIITSFFLGYGTAQRELTPEEREKARQKLHKNWDDDAEEAEMGTGSVFWNAIGATLLISAAPFFILFFIPLDNSEENQW